VRFRDLESVLWAAAVLGVVYIVRRAFGAVEYGGELLQTAQTRTADVIEHFFPLVDSSSLITHAVTFPDGSRHAIPGETVDRNGLFSYQGARFRLLVNASGQKIAVFQG
jgi:hypothetical protein